MAKSGAAAKVVYDPSNSYHSKFHSRACSGEWRNFMSSNIADMYRKPLSRESSSHLDSENEEIDISKILKDIQYLGASNMSWKERKKWENQNVVALGGKPPKKHRTPLSVAKPAMKAQKKREQRKLEEGLVLGRFANNAAKSKNKPQKLKPKDRVLKASEGYFRKGVLNVHHLLARTPPEGDGSHSDGSHIEAGKGKKKRKGKKKGKGNRRKRH